MASNQSRAWLYPGAAVALTVGAVAVAFAYMAVPHPVLGGAATLTALLWALACMLAVPGTAVDARHIQQGGYDWTPSWALYTLGVVFFPPLVSAVYLYQRSKHLGVPIDLTPDEPLSPEEDPNHIPWE